MNGTQMDAVTQRLDRLERENRWIRLAGAVVLVLAVAVVLMGQAQPQKEIRAERFVLQDASGKELATLEALKVGKLVLGSTLFLKQGESGVQLSAFENSALLNLYGKRRGRAVSLTISEDRTGLYIRRGRAKAVLRVTDDAGPSVVLFDANEKPIWNAP
ncbi:MAG: hypothetical protein ACE5JS_20215 [Nitrospinota bacterium]